MSDETQIFGEIYLNVATLTAEQKDAIEVLCGVHPDTDSESGVRAGAEPEDIELMYILANAVIFRQAPPFTQQQIAPVADLVTYGEYLMDVARLLGKSSSIPVPALIIAALMANESVDHAHEEDPRTSFKDAWREIMLQASELFITSSDPAGRG